MNKMRVAIGADHAGFNYKQVIVEYLSDYLIKDYGTYSEDSVDYPDFARPVAVAIEEHEFDFGILICGSANGVAITANRRQGIRAAICWTEELAQLARSHNNANILCIPARFVSLEMAIKMTTVFLSTTFEGGRHAKRVDKIDC